MIILEDLRIDLPGFSLRDIDLKVNRGEFFALVGPTGAGKTLILESIAGLIKPSRGRIWIAGREVSSLPPEKRAVGIVYQDHALFPHLDVRRNITYGLRYHQRRGDTRRREAEVERIMARLGISHLGDRSVTNLSGGEKQRVALARALAVEPEVLLLDEPLSALDPNLRQGLGNMLAELHRETGLTCLMVTHEFSEVLSLAQRMAVIRQGRIEQVGTVEEVFNRPASPFVAEFVGIKNLFPARFQDGLAVVGEVTLHLDGASPQGSGHVCVRSQDVRLVPAGTPVPAGVNALKGRVSSLVDHGSHWEAWFQADSLAVHVVLSPGDAGRISLGRDDCLALIAAERIHCIA